MTRRAADPVRTLALLWGAHGREGRTGLSVRAIVTAAIEIADAEGLEAAVMRRVADRLGAGTMSLYTHVPGKPELTALMVDTVLGELYAGSVPGDRDGWRAGLEFVAVQNWELHLRHPWLLDAMAGGRIALGPHLTRKYDLELAPLDGIGLGDVEMDGVLTMVLIYVEGVARMHHAMHRHEADTGQTDAEWWTATGPMLEQLMGGARFPLADRVGTAAGERHNAAADPAYALEFGLARILDGVAALIG